MASWHGANGWRTQGSGAILGAALAALGMCVTACADVEEEEDPHDTAAAVEALRARAAEALPVPGTLQVRLTGGARRSFAFTLSGAAHVALRAAGAGPGVRTALLLERAPGQRPVLARARGSRDHPAALELDLAAGRYRVSLAASGPGTSKLTLSASCVGAGCPEDARMCLFGESFAERDALPELELVDEQRIHAGESLGPDSAAAEQIVAALHASSHGDVRTLAEAFAAVDQGELRRVRFSHRRDGRRFVAWEYGAGDNSYGGYFAEGTSQRLAAIHDGDVTECTRFTQARP